jgi:hypothetical protein
MSLATGPMSFTPGGRPPRLPEPVWWLALAGIAVTLVLAMANFW